MNEPSSKIELECTRHDLPVNCIDVYYSNWNENAALPSAENIEILSLAEKKHLAKLRKMVDQVSYARAHLLLRHTLQRYCGVPAADLDFSLESTGKPKLLINSNVDPIEFNLTHCQNLVACAISRSPVGIDAEPLDRLLESETIERILHPLEQERFRALNSADEAKQIIKYWTCKEAALKAVGCGLTIEPSQVLIDFVNASEATALIYTSKSQTPTAVKLYANLVPNTAHSLTVATLASKNCELRLYAL
jgi:4'-phosphopantetheinyl transferase